jgi:hypothetical protein
MSALAMGARWIVERRSDNPDLPKQTMFGPFTSRAQACEFFGIDADDAETFLSVRRRNYTLVLHPLIA